MHSNLGPLVTEATALPTEPQSLPLKYNLYGRFFFKTLLPAKWLLWGYHYSWTPPQLKRGLHCTVIQHEEEVLNAF